METAIEVRQVQKTFKNGVKAVQGISLSVLTGQVYGVIGPNGAGKTTLMNMISTLLVPDSGDIRVLGESVLQNPKAIRRRINLCSGHANFAWSLTLAENLHFYAMLYGLKGRDRRSRVHELLSAFSLEEYADRRFDEVSTGVKQRLALAKALINNPEVLLLDEPTVGLDPDVSIKVREHIKDYHKATGCTLLITTHYMQEAADLCEQVAFIRDGRVAIQGSPADLLKKFAARDMEAVFLELAK